MGKIQSNTHPEVKFLSTWELVKQDKLPASKIQWWERHRVDIPIPKKEKSEGEGSHGSQASPKTSIANSIRF